MTDGYAANPMCLQSRAAISTGRYYQRFASVRPLPSSERMIGHYLQAAGYATGCTGKWHSGSDGCWDGAAVNHRWDVTRDGRRYGERFDCIVETTGN